MEVIVANNRYTSLSYKNHGNKYQSGAWVRKQHQIQFLSPSEADSLEPDGNCTPQQADVPQTIGGKTMPDMKLK